MKASCQRVRSILTGSSLLSSDEIGIIQTNDRMSLRREDVAVPYCSGVAVRNELQLRLGPKDTSIASLTPLLNSICSRICRDRTGDTKKLAILVSFWSEAQLKFIPYGTPLQ